MDHNKKSNKNLKIILFVLGGIALLAAILFFVLNIKNNSPKYVGDFSLTSINPNSFELRFGFFNGNHDYVKTSGNANLKIVNDNGEIVLDKNFNFNETNFRTYTSLLSSSDILSVIFNLAKSDIKKTSESSGIAYLSVNLKDSYFEPLQISVYSLPIYSDAELAQMNEENYNQEKTQINKEITSGNFRIQFLNSGFFTEDSWLGKNKYYRIDIKIQNIGNKADILTISDLALITPDGHQYEKDYGGTLDTIYDTYYPGVSKEGYILFKDVPKELKYTLAYNMGYDKNWNPVSYTLNI